MPHPAPLNSHTLPITPGCDCGAPVHEGPHDAALVELTPDEEREAYQFGKLTGIGFARGKQAIQEAKASKAAEQAPPLRVFTIQGGAYQVDARARYASIGDIVIRVDGRFGRNLTANDAPERHTIYTAARLSLESEWFELTIRKAAHDYLDTWLDLERAFFDDQNSREYSLVAAACIGFLSVQRCFYLRDIVAGMTGPYLSRVKADLEARLRGEPGKVALP